MQVDVEHKISEILTNPMEEYGKYFPERKDKVSKTNEAFSSERNLRFTKYG